MEVEEFYQNTVNQAAAEAESFWVGHLFQRAGRIDCEFYKIAFDQDHGWCSFYTHNLRPNGMTPSFLSKCDVENYFNKVDRFAWDYWSDEKEDIRISDFVRYIEKPSIYKEYSKTPNIKWLNQIHFSDNKNYFELKYVEGGKELCHSLDYSESDASNIFEVENKKSHHQYCVTELSFDDYRKYTHLEDSPFSWDFEEDHKNRIKHIIESQTKWLKKHWRGHYEDLTWKDIREEIQKEEEEQRIKDLMEEQEDDEFPEYDEKLKKITYVYLMKNKNNGYYKIGKAQNPKYRERTLQSQEPEVELVFAQPERPDFNEKLLHKEYEKHKIRGEWHNLTETQVKIICHKGKNVQQTISM